MPAEIRNRNKEEWQSYWASATLRAIVPKVFWYTDQEIDGVQMSFLLVERIAFTFSEMTEAVIYKPFSDVALRLNAKCAGLVTRTMVQASIGDISTRDWHSGNVAFPDDDPQHMKLIDELGELPHVCLH